MNKDIMSKAVVLGVIFLFIGVGVASSVGSKIAIHNIDEKILDASSTSVNQGTSSLSFHTFDKTNSRQHEVILLLEDTNDIFNMFEELKHKMVYEPRSNETQALKNNFVDLLDTNGLIPAGLSKNYILSLLNPSWLNNKPKTPMVKNKAPFLTTFILRITNRIVALQQIFKNLLEKTIPKNTITSPPSAVVIAWFCTVTSGGSGSILPLFLLPRPRAIAVWTASLATTLVGEFLTSKGFYAYGAQTGTALGFTGIGITFAFPEYNLYGFAGYSLYTRLSAEYIELIP